MTKLWVLVLSFPEFTDISKINTYFALVFSCGRQLDLTSF
jgi:hypothetical protein